MGDTVQTATAVSQENFALYIEGVRCPFNYLQLGFGDDAIPSIRAEIPALEASFNDSSHLSVRNIPPRTKVVVLYKDTNWEDLPRFTVVFVGELSDPGFSKTTASKSYSFVATHITDNLASLTLASLQADTYLNTVIAGQVEEGVNPALTLSGSIYEFFTPAELAKMGNINVDRLDINDFVKLSLRKFLATGLNSPIRQAWPIQAASQYGLLEHCFSYSDEKSKLNWKKLYSLILNYTFRSLLPAIGKGSSLSYLSMSKTLAQMFLHQLDLIPNPPKYQSTVMLKPQTAFLPIPSCNVVYPLFTTQYDFVEPWSSRPTRMRQIAQPPSGIQADLINKYLRNVSPKQLRVKFEEYEKATEAEKANINLVTEEEKIRGVVDSYNDLPAFISAAIQAVSDGELIEGGRIHFLGPNPANGKIGGIVSEVAKLEEDKIVSFRHIGMILDGVEDFDSEEVKKWTPAFETYTFEELGPEETRVDVSLDAVPEFAEMFNTTWPKALEKVKEGCEEKGSLI
jgi:hypothetical protein